MSRPTIRTALGLLPQALLLLQASTAAALDVKVQAREIAPGEPLRVVVLGAEAMPEATFRGAPLAFSRGRDAFVGWAVVPWGFFTSLWLGTKQAIMLLILADMVFMAPTFIATAKATGALTHPGWSVLEQTRQLLERIERNVVPMRLGALVAVILAVWKPVV